jgi:hypothetical protein
VGQLVKQFTTISKLSQSMAGMSASAKVKAVKELGAAGPGGLIPGMSGLPSLSMKGSSKTASIKDRFKKRKR